MPAPNAFVTLAALSMIVASSRGQEPPDAAETVPFDSGRWEFRATEHRVVEHLGRESLYLEGGIAWLDDVDFLDGVIEFDMAFSEERGFLGVAWRMQDEENMEEFYVRPHQSGNPDANQYTPIDNGLAAWQLYHGEGYGSPVVYRFGEWVHVKVVVSGGQGEVFIDSEDPVLFLHELKREVRPGKIGLVANGEYAPAYFAGFRYRLLTRPSLASPRREIPPAPAGTVTAWAVSTPFAERSLDNRFELGEREKEGLSWTTLAAERTGLVNLAALYGSVEGRDTVFAKITVRSEREQVKKLSFGYSDRIKLYCNDRLIYGGDNSYRSRDYRYLGTIGLFDEVYLPLAKGANEVWLAVSESFGGWGAVARFEDSTGITVEP